MEVDVVMRATESGNTIQAFGEATPAWVVEEILSAAALRDDLPDGFHKLPVGERQKLLGLDGQKKG